MKERRVESAMSRGPEAARASAFRLWLRSLGRRRATADASAEAEQRAAALVCRRCGESACGAGEERTATCSTTSNTACGHCGAGLYHDSASHLHDDCKSCPAAWWT